MTFINIDKNRHLAFIILVRLESQKISIITINYNNADGLEKTIQSIVSQDYEHIEYIVIDGGSTDGSKSIIEQYAGLIDYWVSEPDSGIYNAMNKGIKVATGDYLLFINSGDILLDRTSVARAVEMKLDRDLVYGDLIYLVGQEKKEWRISNVLTFQTFYTSSLPHPATFIKKKLFEKVDLYNESLRIVSDWEFFLLAVCKHNCTYKHIDIFISVFCDRGISSDPNNFSIIEKERRQVLMTHFPLFIDDFEKYLELKEEMRNVRYYIKFKKSFKWFFKRRI